MTEEVKVKLMSNVDHILCSIVPPITIYPGLNFVPKHDGFLKHPHTLARIKKGIFTILDDEVKVDLTDYKALLKDIPNILDVRLLDQIRAEDKRPSILKAVDAQLAFLREGEPRAADADVD